MQNRDAGYSAIKRKNDLSAKSNTENNFGESEEQLFNFTGNIYYLPKNTNQLPNFNGLKSEGKIYTKKIDIQDQAFDKGFPGVGKRFEFFAIDYKAKFYIKNNSSYCFMLGSDDGSKLLIDDTLVINNDYGHALEYKYSCKQLKKGFHKI